MKFYNEIFIQTLHGLRKWTNSSPRSCDGTMTDNSFMTIIKN